VASRVQEQRLAELAGESFRGLYVSVSVGVDVGVFDEKLL